MVVFCQVCQVVFYFLLGVGRLVAFKAIYFGNGGWIQALDHFLCVVFLDERFEDTDLHDLFIEFSQFVKNLIPAWFSHTSWAVGMFLLVNTEI